MKFKEFFLRCTRCIMDNSSDKTITFNENGVCNCCTEMLETRDSVYFPNDEGAIQISAMVKKLKEENAENEYDCVMGISGGLDSSYLLYLGHQWGLRILAFHVDDGYDTIISKNNIQKLCEKCGIKLIIIKPDAEQYNDLIRAYICAGVPNLAVPQDNILFASIYNHMRKYKVKTFLSGSNYALEGILQKDNSYAAQDLTNIKDIHKKFGTKPINKLDFISFQKLTFIRRVLNIETISPLNYIEYTRDKAFNELEVFCGFQYYGRKHLENELTEFIQTFWFPKKFSVDKRTSHLSSMIISGQMTREAALEELRLPLYDEERMEKLIIKILEKTNLSPSEFKRIMGEQSHQHEEYKTTIYPKIIKMIRSLKLK